MAVFMEFQENKPGAISHRISVLPQEHIVDIKMKLQNIIDVPYEFVTLFFNEELHDLEELGSYQIAPESTIQYTISVDFFDLMAVNTLVYMKHGGNADADLHHDGEWMSRNVNADETGNLADSNQTTSVNKNSIVVKIEHVAIHYEYKIQLNRKATVLHLKQEIEKSLKVPIAKQVIFCRNIELGDDVSIQQIKDFTSVVDMAMNAEVVVRVEVTKSDLVHLLREKLTHLPPAAHDLNLPAFFLFANKCCALDEEMSFFQQNVRDHEIVEVVPQCVSPTLLYDTNLSLTLWMRKHQHRSGEPVPIQVKPLCKVEVLKSKLPLDALDYSVPAQIFFTLFHEQHSTGRLFRLWNARTMKSHQIRSGDLLYVVPNLPLNLTVESMDGKCICLQVKAMDGVRRVREKIERLRGNGKDDFPLPPAYSFMYQGQVMEEGKPLFWHQLICQGRRVKLCVPPAAA
ncbi:hypothetical protein ACE6H2_022385 [Prunus campanulata]